MVQSYTGSRKIAFQTIDMEVSLTELEYGYLKFICGETLRSSDEVLREQIRGLQAPGLPSFDQWRQQDIPTVPLLQPGAESNGVVITTDAVDETTIVDAEVTEAPPVRKRRGRKPAAETVDAESAPKKRGRRASTEPRTPGRRGRKPAAAAETMESTLSVPAVEDLGNSHTPAETGNKADTNGTTPLETNGTAAFASEETLSIAATPEAEPEKKTRRRRGSSTPRTAASAPRGRRNASTAGRKPRGRAKKSDD